MRRHRNDKFLEVCCRREAKRSVREGRGGGNAVGMMQKEPLHLGERNIIWDLELKRSTCETYPRNELRGLGHFHLGTKTKFEPGIAYFGVERH